MALIKKLRITMPDKATFEGRLQAGDILTDSIVFIESEKLIWINGNYYPAFSAEAQAKLDAIPDLTGISTILTDLKKIDAGTEDKFQLLYSWSNLENSTKGNTTITLSSASNTTAGVMSAVDKQKLDSLEPGLAPAPSDNTVYTQFNGEWVDSTNITTEESDVINIYSGTIAVGQVINFTPEQYSQIQNGMAIEVTAGNLSNYRIYNTLYPQGIPQLSLSLSDSLGNSYAVFNIDYEGQTANITSTNDFDLTDATARILFPQNTRKSLISIDSYLDKSSSNVAHYIEDDDRLLISKGDEFGIGVVNTTVKEFLNKSGIKYSIEEIETADIWTDGYNINRKTIRVDALGNATTVTIPHGITNLGNLVSINGSLQSSSGGIQLTVPFVGDASNFISAWVDATNLYIECAGDRTSYSGYITLTYTKNE